MEQHASREVLILSAFHDYRTAKRASIQQVADGLVSAGYGVSFVSVRFSRLSRRTGDSRLFLWQRANICEQVNGVTCFLWRTPFHPFAPGRRWLTRLVQPLFDIYAAWPNAAFDALVRKANFIIVESSAAVILLRRLRRLNPGCRLIYYATDRLDTVGAHPYLAMRLCADAPLVDHFSLRSPRMADHFAFAGDRLYRAEFGICEQDFAGIAASPYTRPLNAVSVGSMLFDRSFFETMVSRFPAVMFHVIGAGPDVTLTAYPNLVVYPEMPFKDTLAYVKYATFGIAPYRHAEGVEYLADSSLKLAQFEYFELPAVCPWFAVGESSDRFGYDPADDDSMAAAITQALDHGRGTPRRFLDWAQVAERVLRPEAFAGTEIATPPSNRLADEPPSKGKCH